jgi:gliding motility-associated-like protein
MKVEVTNAGDFDFTWYAGEVVDPTKQIANGPTELTNLAEGYYTVVATDKANGCVSNAVTKYLGGDYFFPEYDIMITPATCSRGGNVRIVNLSSQTQTYTIVDTNGNPVLDLNNMIAGQYVLQVTSPDGCDKTEPFEVTDEVAPYNGITANNDGQNDYFHLACIEMFPQNLVRIYNRAGGLVFEIAGYDNNLKVFDGHGNRGLYLGGKDLPAGTYFWVLFKNNVNEKPKTGFLEIIR